MSTAPQVVESALTRGPQLLDKAPEVDPFQRLFWLPCTLTLDLQVVRFTVGDLLKLTVGMAVETSCHQATDLPLRVNGKLIGWTEFEIVGEKLAVRITDLA